MLQMTAERAEGDYGEYAEREEAALSLALSVVTLHCKSMRMRCHSKYLVHVYVVHVLNISVSEHFLFLRCISLRFSLVFPSLVYCGSSRNCVQVFVLVAASVAFYSLSAFCFLLSAALLMVAPFYFEINKVAKRA